MGATASAKSGDDRHIAVAVPLRAAERNRRVAASVLAGGLAYKLFLWLLPFGLDPRRRARPLATRTAPRTRSRAAVFRERSPTRSATLRVPHSPTRGGSSRSACRSSSGRDSRAQRQFSSSIRSSGTSPLRSPSRSWRRSPSPAGSCAFLAAVALTWWVRDDWPGLLAPVLTFAPLAALWLWSLSTFRTATLPGRRCCPERSSSRSDFRCSTRRSAHFLVPKLEKSTSLYGDLGATTTFLFFMYMTSILVVTAPVLNSSLYDELRNRNEPEREDATSTASPA